MKAHINIIMQFLIPPQYFLWLLFSYDIEMINIFFTSRGSVLCGASLFGGFDGFGWLFFLLLADSYDVNMDLSLAFRLLVILAGRGGKWERQRQGRGTHDLGLCLGQEALLRGVGVLVGQERGQEGEGAIAGGAAELGARLR